MILARFMTSLSDTSQHLQGKGLLCTQGTRIQQRRQPVYEVQQPSQEVLSLIQGLCI